MDATNRAAALCEGVLIQMAQHFHPGTDPKELHKTMLAEAHRQLLEMTASDDSGD